MTTECYNVKCPKHGDWDGPFADCDLECPEETISEGAQNAQQQVQTDSAKPYRLT
jgi:hypothetical protein